MVATSINRAIMKLQKRSERGDIENLIKTFVDVGPLFTLLNTSDHQILFGRRGIGKTHALVYLGEEVKKKGDLVVYVDLSNLGSSGGIYGDGSIPITERASRLLVDTLSEIHSRLFDYFVSNDDIYNLNVFGPYLDDFALAMSTVRITGNVEREFSEKDTRSVGLTTSFGAEAAKDNFKVSMSSAETSGCVKDQSSRVKVAGEERHTVHFGSVRASLERLLNSIKPNRLWVLLDEWSSLPPDVQPYLADLFRRSFFPIRNLTAKIAAIEYRSSFKIALEKNDYVGFELGADVVCNVDLDEFMVFDNDPGRSRSFFSSLFFSHLCSSDEYKAGAVSFGSEEDMINQAFSQRATFDELVRAAEGVPRDAINIASLAAQYGSEEKISVPNIRKAARNWYAQGKESSVSAKETAHSLLRWIVDKVIGERRARAFLLKSDVEHDLIRDLFDSRVLHILKKNISSRDEPGVRFTAYKLDYGCYVELINTSKATAGLLPGEEGAFVEVPPDDYRSIRRAVLELDEFLRSYTPNILEN